MVITTNICNTHTVELRSSLLQSIDGLNVSVFIR